jgi:hypothetical protein
VNVFVVMWIDRHTDPEPLLFVSAEAAIGKARSLVEEYRAEGRVLDEAFVEEQPGPADWLYFAEWNHEGDHIFVVERPLQGNPS